MNVLFLSQIVPYPPHGGVLQRGYNILRELGRHAEVDLVACVHPDEMPTAEKVDAAVRALGTFCRTVQLAPLWPKQSPAHKLAAIGMSTLSSAPFSVIAHRSARFRSLVQAALGSRRYDVVHVDTVALAPFVDLTTDPPAVLTHHNVESVLMERRAEVERGAVARWFLAREAGKLRRYEAEVSAAFPMNIVVSAVDADVLAARVPGVRTALVPNGVDVEYFTPSREPQDESLIYTGGMNMFANRDAVLHFVTDVWPRIAGRRPAARFVAVGQDPPAELRAAAARDPRIEVTGFVDDIRPRVGKAAIYVVPLRVGGGTRLKVLDAMASGKALVSTAIGCEGIDATPGEHLVVADEPEAFAEAVVALLADPARRAALGAAARAQAEARYAWPVIGQRLLEAYRTTIEGRR